MSAPSSTNLSAECVCDLEGETCELHPYGINFEKAPIPMIIHCPECRARHIDVGVFATKPHHTHSCQSCGMTWRPAKVCTVGVQFLPGFKDEPAGAPVISPVTVPPGVAPMPIVSWPAGQRECALETYFRDHPNETSVNLYCGCPKCSPTCAT